MLKRGWLASLIEICSFGVLEMWIRFDSEFYFDSKLSSLSRVQLWKVHHERWIIIICLITDNEMGTIDSWVIIFSSPHPDPLTIDGRVAHQPLCSAISPSHSCTPHIDCFITLTLQIAFFAERRGTSFTLFLPFTRPPFFSSLHRPATVSHVHHYDVERLSSLIMSLCHHAYEVLIPLSPRFLSSPSRLRPVRWTNSPWAPQLSNSCNSFEIYFPIAYVLSIVDQSLLGTCSNHLSVLKLLFELQLLNHLQLLVLIRHPLIISDLRCDTNIIFRHYSSSKEGEGFI